MTSHLNKSYFTNPESLNGEHSFVGAPVSLYNLTKSAQIPFTLDSKFIHLDVILRASFFTQGK